MYHYQNTAELLEPHSGSVVTAAGVVPVEPRTDKHMKLTKSGLWVTGDFVLAEIQQGNNYTPGVCAFEGCKLDKMFAENKLVVASPITSKNIDVTWLPFCAPHYEISADINDYIFVEVPIVVADVPNRNMDDFSFDELTSWRTANSLPAYGTFQGKPVHQDHDNLDDTKAKGVIFDATLTPFRDKYHVKILKGFDRSKDARLAKLVQERNRIGHSMGALVERTECSLPTCRYISDGTQTCKHINGGAGKGTIYNIDGRRHLTYEKMLDFYFIESSSVNDAAYVVALSDKIWV